jgi:hypothetical protein
LAEGLPVRLEIKTRGNLAGTCTVDVLHGRRDTGWRIGCYITTYDNSWVDPHAHDATCRGA